MSGSSTWDISAYERIAFDVESYPDWMLVCFIGEREDGSRDILEIESPDGWPFKEEERQAIVDTLRDGKCLVSFNGAAYDIPMLRVMAVCDDWGNPHDAVRVNAESNDLIHNRRGRIDSLKNKPERHVDCERLVVGMKGLKELSAMMHLPDIGELPFDPTAALGDDAESKKTLKDYCIKDCERTLALHDRLRPAVELRLALNDIYPLPKWRKGGFAFALESQIGEWLIDSQCGQNPNKDKTPPMIRWNPPDYLEFDDPKCTELLEQYASADISVSGKGTVALPPELSKKASSFHYGGIEYAFGTGGLHTTQKHAINIKSTPGEWEVRDYDVASYYPSILLQNKASPVPGFSDVYRGLVERRLSAKAEGRQSEASALKIAVNGLFGKLDQPGSAVYDPKTFFDVTASGQFALMMLVEGVTREGAKVISANTDGIIVACDPREVDLDGGPIADWQKKTGFVLERTDYAHVAMRDVNNYVCLTTDGKVKAKGAYGRRELSTRPMFDIAAEAAVKWMSDGIPPEETVSECKDLRKFLCVRKMTSGVVRDETGDTFGSLVRFYRSTDPKASLVVMAQQPRMVPDGKGGRAVPLLEGDPPPLPDDLDLGFYIDKAHSMIEELGDLTLAKTRPNAQSDMFDLAM